MSFMEERPTRYVFYFVIIMFVSLIVIVSIYHNGGSEIDPIKTSNITGEELEVTMILTTVQINVLIGLGVGMIVFVILHRFYLRLHDAVEEFKHERNGQ